MVFARFLAILCLCLPISSAFAATYRLFTERGVQAADYRRILRRLRAGDIVQFTNGREFQIQGFLGMGNSTRIFDIGDGKALRLNFLSERLLRLHRIQPGQFSLAGYARGFSKLSDSEIPLVRVFLSESDPREYLVVERVNIEFTFADFLKSRTGAGIRDPRFQDAKTLYQTFYEFVATTERFTFIEDLKFDQIGWDGTKWILLDWDGEVVRKSWLTSGFAFERIEKFATLPERIQRRVREILAAKRKSRCSGWFASFLAGNP